MSKNDKKQFNLLIIVSWAVYVCAYIGRLNLNSYIEPMRAQLSASKTELGLISSLFFFAYGIGQLIHGILSKKYNTRYSVAVALIGSALSNLSMALCADLTQMKIAWLINGIFQSILWSSLVKTLSSKLPEKMLSRAVVAMSTPPALGTFIIYGTSALCSSADAGYRIIFLIPAFLLMLAGAVWFVATGLLKLPVVEGKSENIVKERKGKNQFSKTLIISFCLLALVAVSNGFIKDGETTWMPSVLREAYGMKESFSILLTVLLPLIGIFGAGFSAYLHKREKNTSLINSRLFFIEGVLLGLFIFASLYLGVKSAVFLISIFALSAILMSAINNVITSIIPMFIKDKENSGLLAGVLDTFCYVGSMLSSALLGYISDRNGWTGVYICFLTFALTACLLSFVSSVLAKREKV